MPFEGVNQDSAFSQGVHKMQTITDPDSQADGSALAERETGKAAGLQTWTADIQSCPRPHMALATHKNSGPDSSSTVLAFPRDVALRGHQRWTPVDNESAADAPNGSRAGPRKWALRTHEYLYRASKLRCSSCSLPHRPAFWSPLAQEGIEHTMTKGPLKSKTVTAFKHVANSTR